MNAAGLLVAAAAPTILGAAIMVDRWRAHHASPARVIPVVDGRTYRDAERAADQLIGQGQYQRARYHLHAMRVWLRGEIHTGPARHRARRAAQLEAVELTMQEVDR